ncbi:MAG: hypothetical protein KDD04_09565 [Sinomicrobium sp.]|nr:hypothetical protein [Sinomicrobium sp.]
MRTKFFSLLFVFAVLASIATTAYAGCGCTEEEKGASEETVVEVAPAEAE